MKIYRLTLEDGAYFYEQIDLSEEEDDDEDLFVDVDKKKIEKSIERLFLRCEELDSDIFILENNLHLVDYGTGISKKEGSKILKELNKKRHIREQLEKQIETLCDIL